MESLFELLWDLFQELASEVLLVLIGFIGLAILCAVYIVGEYIWEVLRDVCRAVEDVFRR